MKKLWIGHCHKIEADMKKQGKKFTDEGKLLEAERIQQRTTYDIENDA